METHPLRREAICPKSASWQILKLGLKAKPLTMDFWKFTNMVQSQNIAIINENIQWPNFDFKITRVFNKYYSDTLQHLISSAILP